MTPGARISAAIAVLDRVLAGDPAEKALTNWGRASRFAGSGDRAAVRDLVFDALRQRNSAAALGGGLTGRGLVLGLARATGQEALFSGEGHAPEPPLPDEAGRAPGPMESLDLPDWLVPDLRTSLGPEFDAVAQAQRGGPADFVAVDAVHHHGLARRRHRIADIAHALAAEGGLVLHHDPVGVEPRHVAVGQHGGHSRQGFRLGGVDIRRPKAIRYLDGI